MLMFCSSEKYFFIGMPSRYEEDIINIAVY